MLEGVSQAEGLRSRVAVLCCAALMDSRRIEDRTQCVRLVAEARRTGALHRWRDGWWRAEPDDGRAAPPFRFTDRMVWRLTKRGVLEGEDRMRRLTPSGEKAY